MTPASRPALRPLRALAACRRGAVTLMVAVAALSIMLTSMLAIDVARAHLAKTKLQQATDAAALSAAQDFHATSLETGMRQVFAANFPSGYLGTTLESFTHAVTASENDSELLTLDTQVSLPSPAAQLAQLVGFDGYHLRASATIERRTRGMELALVLDITWSMTVGNKASGLKTAATDLIDILYGSKTAVPNLWVGIVPYIAAVNIGKPNIGFLSSTDRARISAADFGTDGWAGCVLARSVPYDQTDDPPSVRAFNSYLYPDNNSNATFFGNDWGAPRNPPIGFTIKYNAGAAYYTGWGPNVGCPPAITPLIQSKATVLTAVNNLVPWQNGGTIISEGLAWGWRVISPRWRGQWSGAAAKLPLAYGTASMDKVIVLLTDGENQMPVSGSHSTYHAYQTYTALGSSQAAAETELDRRTDVVCTAVKTAGIKLYTITFGSVTKRGRDLMQSCATSPADYFHSPNNATLRTVFKTIASQLTNVRIVQ
jgi:Flp pilus assembly protein TadG